MKLGPSENAVPGVMCTGCCGGALDPVSRIQVPVELPSSMIAISSGSQPSVVTVQWSRDTSRGP